VKPLLDDLLEAWEQAKIEVFKIETDLENQAVKVDESTEQQQTDVAKIECFVKELVESGFDEALAMKSVAYVDPADIDSCDTTQGKDIFCDAVTCLIRNILIDFDVEMYF